MANPDTQLATQQNRPWFVEWHYQVAENTAAVTTSVLAAVALKKAFDQFMPNEWASGITAGTISFILLLTLITIVIPIRRGRRERNRVRQTGPMVSYFTTDRRDATNYTVTDDKILSHYLSWLNTSQASLLHLTGRSGAGKSSLIEGYLRPRLKQADPSVRVLVVRNAANYLSELRFELVEFWSTDEAKEKKRKMPHLELISEAIKHINKPLLIVFDQFEEFLVQCSNDVERADLIIEMKTFLHMFLKQKLERVKVLLSYRDDDDDLLLPLKLPALTRDENLKIIRPWETPQGREFLKKCPILEISDDSIDRALADAIRYEENKRHIRPIVANMLGLALIEFANDPKLRRLGDDLLKNFVRQQLRGELQENRAKILLEMLTDYRSKQPRTVDALASVCGLKTAAVVRQLRNFHEVGFVRLLNPDVTAEGQRKWEIAHDFVATLLDRVLDGVTRTAWRQVRPYLAPVAFALAVLGAVFAYPTYQRLSQEAFVGQLSTNYGLQIINKSNDGRISVRLFPLLHNPPTIEFVPLLKKVGKVSKLYLESTNLINVDGMNELPDLEFLSLRANLFTLTNIDGLNNLTSLQHLDLDFCPKIVSYKSITSLTNLKFLDLSTGENLKDVEDLKGLTSLQSLRLNSCNNLTNIGGLQELKALQVLDLNECSKLEHVKGLKGLFALKKLKLSGTGIADEGLMELQDLQNLNELDLCNTKISNAGLDVLKKLNNLTHLNLSSTKITDAGLKNLDTLYKLQVLNLHMTQINDIGILQLSRLITITTLDLSGTQITDVGLKELTALQNIIKLELYGTQITDVGMKELKMFPKLTHLELGGQNITDIGLIEL